MILSSPPAAFPNDRDFDPFEKALGLLVIHPRG